MQDGVEQDADHAEIVGAPSRCVEQVADPAEVGSIQAASACCSTGRFGCLSGFFGEFSPAFKEVAVQFLQLVQSLSDHAVIGM